MTLAEQNTELQSNNQAIFDFESEASQNAQAANAVQILTSWRENADAVLMTLLNDSSAWEFVYQEQIASEHFPVGRWRTLFEYAQDSTDKQNNISHQVIKNKWMNDGAFSAAAQDKPWLEKILVAGQHERAMVRLVNDIETNLMLLREQKNAHFEKLSIDDTYNRWKSGKISGSEFSEQVAEIRQKASGGIAVTPSFEAVDIMPQDFTASKFLVTPSEQINDILGGGMMAGIHITGGQHKTMKTRLQLAMIAYWLITKPDFNATIYSLEMEQQKVLKYFVAMYASQYIQTNYGNILDGNGVLMHAVSVKDFYFNPDKHFWKYPIRAEAVKWATNLLLDAARPDGVQGHYRLRIYDGSKEGGRVQYPENFETVSYMDVVKYGVPDYELFDHVHHVSVKGSDGDANTPMAKIAAIAPILHENRMDRKNIMNVVAQRNKSANNSGVARQEVGVKGGEELTEKAVGALITHGNFDENDNVQLGTMFVNSTAMRDSASTGGRIVEVPIHQQSGWIYPTENLDHIFKK